MSSDLCRNSLNLVEYSRWMFHILIIYYKERYITNLLTMNYHEICLFCNKPLDPLSNGNRQHCPDCTYKKKLFRNKNNYQDKKSKLEVFKKADSILKLFHDIYGSEKYIPAQLLDDAGMDWGICNSEITIEKLMAKQIDKYAYCLFNNKTIRIWRLQN